MLNGILILCYYRAARATATNPTMKKASVRFRKKREQKSGTVSNRPRRGENRGRGVHASRTKSNVSWLFRPRCTSSQCIQGEMTTGYLTNGGRPMSISSSSCSWTTRITLPLVVCFLATLTSWKINCSEWIIVLRVARDSYLLLMHQITMFY